MKLLGCISFNSNVERNKGMNKPINILDKDYLQWIKELCKRYRQSQIKAAVKVNTEMLKFYWSLGRDIVALKAEARWGSKFFVNLSRDLKELNPKATCFSPTNLLYMKNFFRLYQDYSEITPQVGEQFEKDIFSLPWGHHKLLIDKFLTVPQKERYLPMPDYDKSTATEVVLTLPGTVIDENYSLLLLENKNMSLTDAVLLDSVQKGKRISPEAIAMLRKRKLIEGRLPHIFIAKDIAQVTDQKIEYSKHKGLDDKKCEALLLDSLKDHGSLTKPEIVRLLWDVLPDQLDDKQKDNKLDYLLKRLRKAGKIWTERNEVTSIWHLTEN